MNKKTYINPELEVIKVQTQQMLAVSGDVSTPTPGDAGGAAAPGFDTDTNMFGF